MPGPINYTKASVTTDTEYWRKYAEAQVPVFPPQPRDHVREYGLRLWDGEHWIRHYIDKSNGGTGTLCGLPCEFRPNESQDVWRTCELCAEKSSRMRSK